MAPLTQSDDAACAVNDISFCVVAQALRMVKRRCELKQILRAETIAQNGRGQSTRILLTHPASAAADRALIALSTRSQRCREIDIALPEGSAILAGGLKFNCKDDPHRAVQQFFPPKVDVLGVFCKHLHMPVTIKDVARKAGVSTATVSRVLNGSDYFDQETARLVNEAVEALGYQRNIHWKRLAQNSSETICFLLGNREALNSMQVRMLMACERTLAEAGYDLVFAPFRYRPETPAAQLVLPRLVAQPGMIDGVILAGLHYENFLEVLVKRKLPYALLGNTYIGAKEKLKNDAVIYDDVAGAYEATQYLLRLGHRNIAFVGNIALPWFKRRYDGYHRAMKEAGLEEMTATARWDVGYIEYGNLAAAELLRGTKTPTAIFGANDEVAGGVWKALISRGIAIPKQISLLGFGDREDFSILEPALTTVSVFQDKLGAELAQLLLQRLQKPTLHVASCVFPCQLIERNSCAAPAPSLRLLRER
jgi:DNA-binding LacI/PurR family transcriptional regulator